MKTRLKKKIVTLPTRADVEILLADIRHLKIGLLKIKADREEAIKKIDDRCAGPLNDIQKMLDEKISEVQAWAEANPQEFENRKSLEFTHGTIGFRTGTPKLALLSRAWDWGKALAAVCHYLPNFIRSTPEIDKEAIIAQRDDQAIQLALPRCGLKVTQAESFYVEPNIEPVQIKHKEAA